MLLPTFLSEKQVSDIEASLNTNKQANDSLISAHFANSTADEFRRQLVAFIERKKEDISMLCQKDSETFGKSIEGARTLGTASESIKKLLKAVEMDLHSSVVTYKAYLETAVKIRQEIQEGDNKLRANLEFQVLIQQLRNVNAEIAKGHLYIAVVRTLEFANYDSPIANCATIQYLQKDVDPIIAHIESLADKKLTQWMIAFNEKCVSIGDAFLKMNEAETLDMSPIYEYYMIEKHLGKTEVFLQMYNEKREKQLKFIRERKQNENIDSINFLFCIAAGFFYTEWRISADGFNLLEPARAERMWNDTIGYMTRDFSQRITTDKIEDWINLSKLISHFDERMSTCSLNSSDLQKLIRKRGKQFCKSLHKLGSTQIKQTIDNSNLEVLTVKNAEELAPLLELELASQVTTFPADMIFIPELPKVCHIIEQTLRKWIDFSLVSQDSLLVELYENLVSAYANAMKNVIKSAPHIPLCGNLIASLSAFDGVLNYFEPFLQKSMTSNVKQDKEKLKRILLKAGEVGIDRLTALFAAFSDEMIDTFYMRELPKEPPPHGNSLQVVMYFETMSSILQAVIPQKIFQSTIEKIAQHISNTFVKLIISMEKIQWTPDYISILSQNVSYIGNWSTLISLPSAKAQMNGLIKMLSLLGSSQLATLSSDPNFITRNQDIPFKAMVSILQRYIPHTNKKLNIIQPNLVNSLIQKFSATLRRNSD